MRFLFIFAFGLSVLSGLVKADSLSVADIAEEVVVRIQTERHNSQEKFDLIIEEAAKLSVEDRVEYFGFVLHSFNKLGLESQFEIVLFKEALSDASLVSATAARGRFIEAVADWCGGQQFENPNVAHELLVALFKLNDLSVEDLKNITRFFTFHRRFESETPDPDYEFVLSNVMQNPAVNAEFAKYYLYEELIKFNAPLLVRSRLLTQLRSKKLLSEDLNEMSREYSEQLKRSDLFLSKFSAESNLNEVMEYLGTDDNAVYLLKAIQQWMNSRKLSREDLSKIYALILSKADSLLGTLEDSPRTLANDFVRTIRDVILTADVDDEVRLKLVNFVLRHATSVSEASERERYMIGSIFIYNFDKRPFWMSPLTQQVLEALVKSSRPSIPRTENDPNRTNEDQTIRMVLESLELCQNEEKAAQFGFERKWCSVITSPDRILDLVMENQNIDAKFREWAQVLKR